MCMPSLPSPSEDVVTCDRCGWMTHEDCYGIAPLEGEEETEGEEVPWFCDSCKMGVQPVRHAHTVTHTHTRTHTFHTYIFVLYIRLVYIQRVCTIYKWLLQVN